MTSVADAGGQPTQTQTLPSVGRFAIVRTVMILLLPLVILGVFAGPIINWAAGSHLLDPILSPLGLGPYNTRVVLIATGILGGVYGVIGSFITLRRRALIGDVLSHAMLPGIAAAFLIMVALGGTGKYTPGLLFGAVVSGGLGMAAVILITRTTRLKEDAAMGIVLSVTFGIGVALLGVAQKLRQGNAAGLETFLYGKTASMLIDDAELIAVIGGGAVWVTLLLFKELSLLCFDMDFAGALGVRPTALDAILLAVMTAATVIGLQAVGLILVVAMLVIPAAAARFWTDRVGMMVALAAGLGALSGVLGAYTSAHIEKWPAGATIVLVAALVFLMSLLFGTRRGVVRHAISRSLLRRRIARQHVLRAMYELGETPGVTAGVSEQALLPLRAWSPAELRRSLRRAQRFGSVARAADATWTLTEQGSRDAARMVRNHRLWELYLITRADIAPSHVDRDADQIEHVLSSEMIARLEDILRTQGPPRSPHEIGPAGINGGRTG